MRKQMDEKKKVATQTMEKHCKRLDPNLPWQELKEQIRSQSAHLKKYSLSEMTEEYLTELAFAEKTASDWLVERDENTKLKSRIEALTKEVDLLRSMNEIYGAHIDRIKGGRSGSYLKIVSRN